MEIDLRKLEKEREIYYRGLLEFVKHLSLNNQRNFLKLLIGYTDTTLKLERIYEV